jgi:hypothetical protein
MTSTEHDGSRPAGFVVLNDAPVGDGAADDLLEVTEVADSMASLITASRAVAPFTVAVDAAWGAGKSSLLRRLETRLAEQPATSVVWFNAWTSGPTSALEGLIKSVLLRFDRNVIRRVVRSMSRRAHLFGVLRGIGLVAASFFGLAGVVDQVWQRLSLDAQARNEIKDVLRDAIGGWAATQRSTGDQHLLVVFVDDLDRCAGSRVVEICEAIKLYLDVPGIVFVLACHQSVLWQALRDSGLVSDQVPAVEYLEKIIQISYRIPVPSMDQAMRLVDGYLELSNTTALFDDSMKKVVIERTGRNPRRIKRLINSLILEYHLDRSWDEFGVKNLVRIIMVQHFYPDFYRVLANPRYRDPIHDFLLYREYRTAVKKGVEQMQERWAALFESMDGPASPTEESLADVERELPPEYRELVLDREFVALLESIRVPNSARLVEHLRRRPLSTFSASTAAPPGADTLQRLLALPTTHVVVDGDNVANARHPELTPDERRYWLTRQVGLLAARTDADFTIVFHGEGVSVDPLPSLPPLPSINVRMMFGYDGDGRSVEDLVRALVAAESDGRPMVVVTSDHALAVSVRERGAHAVPSAAMLGLVEWMQR